MRLDGVPALAGNEMQDQLLAVVIPAFNEARSIEAVVRQVSRRALAIVVNDGSTDNTAALALAAGAHVVSHPRNLGYDAALESGLRSAHALGFLYAATMDADGQHDTGLLDHLMNELENGADLVLGHRDCTQRWAETLFCLVSRAVWGLRDPLCGMKCYRLETLSRLQKWNTYASVGTELAIRLVKGGAVVRQIPVKTRQREDESRFGHGLAPNLKICRSLLKALICNSAMDIPSRK